MNAPAISPAKAHVAHVAQLLGGRLAQLVPAHVTNEDIERVLENGAVLSRAVASIFERSLPVAVVDVGGGKTATVTLLADAVCGSGRPSCEGGQKFSGVND